MPTVGTGVWPRGEAKLGMAVSCIWVLKFKFHFCFWLKFSKRKHLGGNTWWPKGFGAPSPVGETWTLGQELAVVGVWSMKQWMGALRGSQCLHLSDNDTKDPIEGSIRNLWEQTLFAYKTGTCPNINNSVLNEMRSRWKNCSGNRRTQTQRLSGDETL